MRVCSRVETIKEFTGKDYSVKRFQDQKNMHEPKDPESGVQMGSLFQNQISIRGTVPWISHIVPLWVTAAGRRQSQ
jgi:hypothetical protein